MNYKNTIRGIFKDRPNRFIARCLLDGQEVRAHVKNTGRCRELLLPGAQVMLQLSDNPAAPLFVRHILQYSPDELWIGTESGIVVYNIRTRRYQHLKSSPYDPYSLSDNAVYSLCKDREGGLWIGSFFGGINYLPQRNSDFEKYYHTDDPHSLRGRRVREICPGSDGRLWIGTEDAGLYQFDPATRSFGFFAPSREFTNVHGLQMAG